jgi:glucose/mannose-6-phosphate isomerase
MEQGRDFMDLNNWLAFKTLDPEDMLSNIDGLPDQLEKAWQLGNSLPLPAWSGIERVVITGMGGSAIGADLLVAYSEASCTVPVLVHRDYVLPGWAKGPNTLVIASSHSGNTEETLSAFADATQKGCSRLAIATGGALAKAAQETGAALWTFDHWGQPRAAVGFSFGLLLAAFTRLGLIPDPRQELAGAVQAMRAQQAHITAEVPIAQNLAKRQAGQLLDRWVTVLGSGILSPVARRWKGQISELAKAWAQFEFLPEADHNTLAGSLNPRELLAHTVVLFLKSPSDHPRNRLRLDYTSKVLMLDGLATDSYKAQGDTPLANLWTALHFGDYMAYYLAMLYEVDPTPVEALQKLKQELGAVPVK